jgi:serine/threonine protein kinase
MQPSTVYCDNCGAANRPTARFCISCGQAMAAASSLPPTVQAAPGIPSLPPTVQAGSVPSSPSLTGLLPANSLLKQRYLILKRLGQGGMGAVYQAADTRLGDRLVAVKEMSQKGLDAQEITEAAEAFKREAHMLAGLPHHPNLPSIYDHFGDGGRWYLVMDFIAGQTLEEYLAKAGGKLPVEEVLDIGIQVCTVLGYLHSHQPPIIFRDLKPANVMRTLNGQLYLIDFGIARHFKPGQARDTAAYGSMGYAAPEQYGKAQTTPQSDIYSLGATLHHLLAGSDPSQSPFVFAPLTGGSDSC